MKVLTSTFLAPKSSNEGVLVPDPNDATPDATPDASSKRPPSKEQEKAVVHVQQSTRLDEVHSIA